MLLGLPYVPGVCVLDCQSIEIEHYALDLFSWQTDGLIWVVDSADRGRLQDCKRELHDLLGQEVSAYLHDSSSNFVEMNVLLNRGFLD